MHVAFEIVRPWPTVTRIPEHRLERRRVVGYPWAELGWHQFWIVGRWEVYWPAAVTFWTRDRVDEPRLRVRFPLLRDLRRRWLTRCEWCGGRSRKGDWVNVSGRQDRQRGRWWQRERGLYHGDCSSIEHAKTVCLCGPDGGPWESELGGYAYGACASCGKYRGWLSEDERSSPTYPGLHVNRLLAAIPAGERDERVMEVVRDMWRFYREGRL